MPLKVYLWPHPEQIEENNGIGRVVHAQYKYLPKYDIELVETSAQAQVIASHTRRGELPWIDVLHLHGIYWTADADRRGFRYDRWHHGINEEIIDSSRHAKIITVPSEWVAYPFQRDMRISPRVIGHGIDVPLYANHRTTKGTYVLWNKNRAQDVCDPAPADYLAAGGLDVWSTFTKSGPSAMTVLGPQGDGQMRETLSNCLMYLATTEETFGIGTVEALAMGKPVLGFDWGGTRDLVKHKETGYLVRPYDYPALLEGYHWIIEHYDDLSAAARKSALPYTWENAAAQYAQAYHDAFALKRSYKLSVVVTNHNYSKYVGEAIDSAKANQAEVIVVDDASTDNSLEVIHAHAPDKIISKRDNEGVAAARNDGIAAASGDLIVCLDADDYLSPNYADTLIPAFRRDHGLGVAYTGLMMIQEGTEPRLAEWPPEFSWDVQASGGVPPQNCIPAGAMFRKEMWQRAGGYRQEYAPGEDAEFWTRGLATGFTAKRVTDDGLFNYRLHPGSASRTKQYVPIDTWLPWIGDKLFPLAAPVSGTHMVSAYPIEISVVVPVGKAHEYLLESIYTCMEGQTFRNWELIIVGDRDLSRPDKPYARFLVKRGQPGPKRQLGTEHARGEFVVYLDADDYLHPEALERMLAMHRQTGLYVYTDWVVDETDEVQESPDYSSEAGKTLLNPVTCLIPKEWVPRWTAAKHLEDRDFYVRMYQEGHYGVRLPQPLLYVRQSTSTRTKKV
jgi:glycosyltransferase involved in cell wall biosynthesis